MLLAMVTALIGMGSLACSSKADSGSPEAESKQSSGASTATDKSRGGEFTMLTYNVAGLPEGMSSSHPEVNMSQIGPLLNAYDLVITQEDWKSPEPNPLAPTRVYHEVLEDLVTLPYKSESAPLPLGKDSTRPEALVSDGLNVFSKFKLGEMTRTRWPRCFGLGTEGAGDCMALKGFAVTTVELEPGVEVLVYDLHMEAGGSALEDEMRQEGLDLLASDIKSRATDLPVIIGGDWNIHGGPDGDATEEAMLAKFIEEVGLTDACRSLDCGEAGRIDRIMVRSGTSVDLSAKTWERPSERFVDMNGEPLSDHEPVVVTIGWKIR